MNRTLFHRLLGVGRIVFGAGLLIAPGASGRLLVGRGGDRKQFQAFIRGFGARDVALGSGIFLTAADPAAARRWLGLAAFADVGDLVANSLIADDMNAVERAFGVGLPAAAALLFGATSATAGSGDAPAPPPVPRSGRATEHGLASTPA